MYTLEEVIKIALDKHFDSTKDLQVADVAVSDLESFIAGALEMIEDILLTSVCAGDLAKDDPAFIAGVLSVSLPFLSHATTMNISTMLCDISKGRENPYEGTAMYKALSDMDFPDDQPVAK